MRCRASCSPLLLGLRKASFLFFVKFALVHAVGVMFASVFAFFAVFCVLGLLMAVLPPRAFNDAPPICAESWWCTWSLCSALRSRFRMRSGVHTGAHRHGALLLPSTWILGLCQSLLRGRASPSLLELARLALPGLAAVVAIAFCTYAIGYRRHFVRIAEIADTSDVGRVPQASRLGIFLDRLLLRTPFQRACFRFILKTMLRSESHRLVLTAVGGLALVLASQALMDVAQSAKSWRKAALSPDALSIPFILSFLVIVGIRVVFEIPAELRSNWIFQLMFDQDAAECETLARKVILISVLPWLVLMAFLPYMYLEGWFIASLHTILVAVWALLLTNIVLTRFRKLPFTCTLPVFKQHSFVIVLSVGFGFLLYAVSTPEFESSALAEPLRMLSLITVAAVAWYIPRRLDKNAIDIERKIIFEESATQTVEMLRLGDYGR